MENENKTVEETKTKEVSETTTEENFKVFKKEEEYNTAIKSERSKAKKEVLDELGITNLNEAKEKINSAATLQNELSEAQKKLTNLTEEFSLQKAGVLDQYKEEVLTLAKAKVSEEKDFETSLGEVLTKMPFVANKKYKGKVGGEGKGDNEEQEAYTANLQKKYPWLKK